MKFFGRMDFLCLVLCFVCAGVRGWGFAAMGAICGVSRLGAMFFWGGYVCGGGAKFLHN